jgi:membrane-bound lytic murein transglycosylase A
MRGSASLKAFVVLLCLSAGCARSPVRQTPPREPIKSPDQAMRPAQKSPILDDDLDFQTLVAALAANVRHLRSHADLVPRFHFGPRVLSREEYLATLEHLLSVASRDPSGESFRKALAESFEPYEVYGQEDWGDVFITSYFEPVIEGSKKRNGRFTQPLYAPPDDMVLVDLSSFVTVRPSLGALQENVLEQRSRQNFLRGRLTRSATPGRPPQVVPYLDRAAITAGVATKDARIPSKILAWVDPIDAFFLEIQGSGVVRMSDGKEMKVGYAAQNGHPYVAIGRHLLDKIPKEKMSMQAIEAHLRSLSPEEAQKVMNLNPSFVFFQELPNAGLAYLGTEVVSGRTIATDHGYFPKGVLAFLEFERPVFSSLQDESPREWKRSSRFVLDQDTGGAIRGPHRVDLFWGRGAEAKQAAGVMRNRGRLVYFVPKSTFIDQLRSMGLIPVPTTELQTNSH